jgi:acetoacetyl-CoA synthetase
VLEGFPEVLDCVACGQRRPGDADERVLLFLKMSDGSHLDETLRSRVRHAIRKQLSARHVPSHILEVADIPCTLNGKKTERVVSDVVNGRKPRALGSIANPECLNEYEKIADLDKRVVGNNLKL